jgi:hypothetical protein
MSYRLTPVDSEQEKRVLTGLIISTKFCRDAIPILKAEHLEIEYGRIFLRWVKNYYDEYRKAPGIHIQDLFEEQRPRMREEVVGLVGGFLADLSEKYSLEDDSKFNSDYLLDQLKNMIRQREIGRTADRMKDLALAGKLDEAEREMVKYRKETSQAVSQWVNPFSDAFMESVLDEEEEFLFKFPGKLGELMGPLRREYLVSFMGPMKRGKSFLLMEAGVQSMLTRLKTAFINLEMRGKGSGMRLFKRVTSMAPAGKSEMIRFPVFDCARNQDGSCTNGNRVGRIQLLNQEGFRPKFENTPTGYLPCTICRGDKSDRFMVESWWTVIKREEMTLSRLKKYVSGVNMMYAAGRNFRMITYPPYSANLQDVMTDLSKLEDSEGFVPDVIVLDYADILKPEDLGDVGRDRYDRTWKALKNMAATRKCIVITATQATRKTLDTRSVKGSDTSEDIRKAAHVELSVGINQTPAEKKRGIIRWNILFARDMDFDPRRMVVGLQNLAQGQPMLDTEEGQIDIDETKGE